MTSTRPIGRPPRRPKSPPRLRLSAVAAALGLFAALWGTMVGKTVPELLRSNEREVAKFRSHVDAVRLDASWDLTDLAATRIAGSQSRVFFSVPQGELATTMPFPELEITPRSWSDPTKAPKQLTALFGGLQPPTQLAADYREFVAAPS